MFRAGEPLEPDPLIEVYKRDVEVTLLRENLRRSVEERFACLMALREFAEELRRSGAAARHTRVKRAAGRLKDLESLAELEKILAGRCKP